MTIQLQGNIQHRSVTCLTLRKLTGWLMPSFLTTLNLKFVTK
ncbi:TPA: phage antirepressor N-terminal domain-containing protein [Providencia alcalifaciens]|nr:phage antirepressor N-terminal domain-containing protein [Providencia alcalifaciens]